MDISQIKKLIHLLNDNNLGELKVQEGDFKITIRHKDFAKTSGVASVVSAPQPLPHQIQHQLLLPQKQRKKKLFQEIFLQ